MRTQWLSILGLFLVTTIIGSLNNNQTLSRNKRQLSLFSIVQFPNQQCTSSSSSSTYGTCYTSSECSSKGGGSDGSCAAGFGVCCVVYTSTCGSTISTNTTYVRNPNYPSSYTPSSTGTCTFTFSKISDDICQLRLDFDTMSGFTTTGTVGACSDTFAVAGQTGKDPPTICGTNTGYHMYVEFGATSTDTVKITNTYSSTTSAKTFNILARQISCTADWKAPTDCVQYHTGISGNIKSYNFAGAQLLKNQRYMNCIRTERGYCRILWKESSTTSPDPFEFHQNKGPNPAAVTGSGGSDTLSCPLFIIIPNLSPDGTTKIPDDPGTSAYQTQMCGSNFGIEGQAVSQSLITKQQPFILGVYTDTTDITNPSSGFNLDYTQLPCGS